jgi:hypothetical protein
MSLWVSNSHRHYLPDDAISIRADTLDSQAGAFPPFNPAQAFPETSGGSHIERIQNRAQRPSDHLGVLEELAGREQPVTNCLTNCREQIGGLRVVTTEITGMLPREISAKAAHLGDKLPQYVYRLAIARLRVRLGHFAFNQRAPRRLGFGSVVFVSHDAQDTQAGLAPWRPPPLPLCIGSADGIGAASRAHDRATAVARGCRPGFETPRPAGRSLQRTLRARFANRLPSVMTEERAATTWQAV